MKKFSIIIPTLNESLIIDKTIEHLLQFDEDIEIIISDGGSTDDTILKSKKHPVKIIQSEMNRGVQLNNGAKISSGEILIFLHADTQLPYNAFSIIAKMFVNDSIKVASFKLSFDHKHFLLKIYAWFTKFDSIFTNFGDQAIVVDREFFFEIGQYPEIPIFEDVAFLRKARQQTKIIKLPAAVITSARRFKDKGIIKTQLLNFYYFDNYFLNQNPKKIHKQYFGMPKENKNGLIIFAKFPEEGKVKTRLAKGIGNFKALLFYKKCAENLFNEAVKIITVKTYLFYDQPSTAEQMKDWINFEFEYHPQINSDLGKRMAESFKTVFNTGIGKAVIVGTDVPDMNEKIICKAYDLLDKYDLVISPSPDGGYNLLGMKQLYAELFQNIKWSSDQVLSRTLENAEQIGLNVTLMDSLVDIDIHSELLEWLAIPKEGNIELKRKIQQIIRKDVV